MRVIKATYPNGEPLYSAFPTSTKEVRKIFWVYGIDAWLMKINGQYYEIMYPSKNGRVFHQTTARHVDDFTCKRWLEIAKANAPAEAIFHEGYQKFNWWGNLDQYIVRETLP